MTEIATPKNPLLRRIEQCRTNPLREGVGPLRSSRELLQALMNRPITPENVAEVPLEDRALVVDQYNEIFVPTEQTLAIAIAMQDMLFAGLDRRDPRLKENRQFIMRSAGLKGARIQDIPLFERPEAPALGMLIEGITGTGKSVIAERVLSLFPQVIVRGPNPSCGWAALKQLVWLRVHMPSDGSRGGFLTGAFLELDRVLGTTYMEQYRSWTVERQLVIFLHLLSLHRCGLLVIEEAQQNALSMHAPYGAEFLTFFLRLLNFGIPTTLIGNPLAFVRLNEFSQDGCRFSESGTFRLEPTMDHESRDWASLWIDRLWKPTLLSEPDAPYQAVSEDPLDQTLEGFIWKRTAGFPRFLARLRREVQARALAEGLSQVTPELVDDVYRTSPKFARIRHLIEAFVHKNHETVGKYKDIPGGDYELMWKEALRDDEDAESLAPHPAPAAPESARRKKAKSAASSPKKATAAPRKAAADLSPADIRSKEFQKELCEQLKEHVAMG